MKIVQEGQTLLKQRKAAGDGFSRERSCRLIPTGTGIAANTRARIQSFTNSQHTNSKCFQFEAIFACNLAASVPILLSLFRSQSALLLMLGHKHVEQSACVTHQQALSITSECIKQPLEKQKEIALPWINSTQTQDKRNHTLNLRYSV